MPRDLGGINRRLTEARRVKVDERDPGRPFALPRDLPRLYRRYTGDTLSEEFLRIALSRRSAEQRATIAAVLSGRSMYAIAQEEGVSHSTIRHRVVDALRQMHRDARGLPRYNLLGRPRMNGQSIPEERRGRYAGRKRKRPTP